MADLVKLAHDIAGNGIKHIFGIPGSGPSLTLIDALEKLGVSFCLTHFEGTAAIMAGSQGRLRGSAGAAISIKGPGLCNMIPGLSVCRFEGFPVVSVSEDYLPGTPASKAHKRISHRDLLSGVSKGERFLSEKGPGFSDLAKWAEAEVPGPVHLNIAGTLVEEDVPLPVLNSCHAGDSDFQKPLDLLEEAERPVIIAGTLGIRKDLSEKLNNLSIPVFSTAAAKGVVDETLDHSAGVYTGVGLGLTPEYSILPRADLILGIGLRHNEILGVKPFHCKSINIDPLAERHCEGFHFNFHINGTPEEMDTLFSALNGKSWGIDELKECREKMRSRLLDAEWMPAEAFSAIENHFHGQARLVLDTGNFCTVGEHMWRVPGPDLYLASGQGRYMGAGLPMALGASITDPEVPTVAFLGDGGAGMFLGEMKIAVRERLPLIIVLMSDSFFGSIRVRSIADNLTQKPVTIDQPSWLKAVEGLGIESVGVENRAEIEGVLGGWDVGKGPLFMEMMFDPEAYQAMVHDLR